VTTADPQADVPTPPGRRLRWPWIAGGTAAALCLLAGVVLLITTSGNDWGNPALAPGGGIDKNALIGEWEGSRTDGGTLALNFIDNRVVVSILGPGVDCEKARKAADWVSGSPYRSLGGGGLGIGNVGYEIDHDRKEIKLGGGDCVAVARPAAGGALMVAGQFKMGNAVYTVPETRVERVRRRGGNTPQAKKEDAAPPAADVADLLRKGGAFWSSAEEATVADEQFKAGHSLWIWPAADKVFVAERGELKIPLRWKVRPNGPPAGSPLGGELAGTAPGIAFRSFSPLPGLDLKAQEGTAEATFPFRYKGEGDTVVYVVAPGKAPVSNLLRLKARGSP
jgi:hypothetical protein